METVIKINDISEINTTLLKKIIEELILTFGNAEITIKHGSDLKPELLNRIKDIENGEKLLSFNLDEFDELSKKILDGKEIQLETIKKSQKDKNGNIVSV